MLGVDLPARYLPANQYWHFAATTLALAGVHAVQCLPVRVNEIEFRSLGLGLGGCLASTVVLIDRSENLKVVRLLVCIVQERTLIKAIITVVICMN